MSLPKRGREHSECHDLPRFHSPTANVIWSCAFRYLELQQPIPSIILCNPRRGQQLAAKHPLPRIVSVQLQIANAQLQIIFAQSHQEERTRFLPEKIKVSILRHRSPPSHFFSSEPPSDNHRGTGSVGCTLAPVDSRKRKSAQVKVTEILNLSSFDVRSSKRIVKIFWNGADPSGVEIKIRPEADSHEIQQS